MNKIKELDVSLANQIAAGEVVERPSSVIKELVENSIDANAKTITVRLFDAGRTFISVEDDGDGMERQDAELAFKRHATSKIATTFDLFRIKTLGFRGEALPSIAAVADVELITSPGELIGTKININGTDMEISNAPLRKGTTITVQNLFYNTPARLKHLKNDYIENANSLEVLQRIALAHPEVSITYINEDKEIFMTTGRGDLLEVIYSLFGAFTARNMVSINYKNPDFKISGYLGEAEIAKSNRYQMITLLNGRSVYMPKVNKAIIDAYHDFLPPTRFPFVVLNFQIDPALVDVNVHPSKKEVRFSKEDDLRSVLLDLIPTTLRHVNQSFTASRPKVQPAVAEEQIKEQLSFEFNNPPVSEYVTTVEVPLPKLVIEDEIVPYGEEKEIICKPSSMKKLYAVAQLQLTYIVAEDEDGGFYIVDQHAANERINYELFQRELNKGLTLREPLIPQLIELTPADVMRIDENVIKQLSSLGIRLEAFGLTTFKITAVPVFKESYDEKIYVEDVLEQILHSDNRDFSLLRHHAISTMACKASVRANDRLDLSSMQYLLDTLLTCDNPYACPHGRPTIVHFSKYELEKMFKRTGI